MPIMFPAGRLRLHDSSTDAESSGIAMFPSYSMYLNNARKNIQEAFNTEISMQGGREGREREGGAEGGGGVGAEGRGAGACAWRHTTRTAHLRKRDK